MTVPAPEPTEAEPEAEAEPTESLAPRSIDTSAPAAPAPPPAPVHSQKLAVPPEKKLIVPGRPPENLPRVQVHKPRKDPNVARVRVDSDGNGSAMFAADAEDVRAVRSQTPARITFEASQTVSITRINVAGAAVRDGTVLVQVIRK